MFHIKFFVDDKHLAETLRSISGVARGLECVPVNNAVASKDGSVRAKTAGGTLELVLKELRSAFPDGVTPKAVQQTIKKLGLSSSSYSYFTRQAVDAGVLKRGKKSGSTTTYDWVK